MAVNPFTQTRWLWMAVLFAGGTLAGCGTFREPIAAKVQDYLPGSLPQMEQREQNPSHKASHATAPNHETCNQGLNLDDCVRIAIDKNPSVRAAREGVKATSESVGEARAPYYPEVGVSAGYSRWQQHAFLPNGLSRPGIPSVIGPTDDWTGGLRARFTLFDSGERRAQLRSAMAGHGAAEEDLARALQDIAFDVHQSYYSFVAATEARSVAEKNFAVAENHVRLTKERKVAGAVPQADVIRAQVEVANSKLALVRADSLVRVTGGNLNTAMGLPVDMQIHIEAHSGQVTSPDEINISGAISQAMHARPELKAALQQIAAARSAVDRTKSEFGPKIRVETGFGWEDSKFPPHDEEWTAGVAIELPIFTGFSTVHKVARTKAELSKEEANMGQLILNVQKEVWTAYSKLKEAYEAIPTAEAQVRDAQESMRSIQERYEAGASTINDLLDAQNALIRAETALVEVRWDYHIAASAFKRTVGDLIADTKESNSPE